MSEKRFSTSIPGVRYREHKTRCLKSGRPDRYFFIRIQADGVRREEGLGWASEGWTVEKAQGVLAGLKTAIRTGEGPRTLSELREQNERQRRAERLSGEGITLAEFFDTHYLPAAKKRKRTWSHDAGRFNKQIRPLFGGYPLCALTPEHMEELLAVLRSSGASESTALQYMAILRQIFNQARSTFVDGLPLWTQPHSPLDGVRLPRATMERERFLSHKEARRLIDAAQDRSIDLAHFIILALNTGLRYGELLRLRWEDVSLQQGVVIVRAEDMRKPGGKVPLNASAIAAFRARLETRHKGVQAVFPLDVVGNDGDALRRQYELLVEDLGLNRESTSPRDRIVFHTLRHTFASWLAISGKADIYRIKTLMRHRTLRMTERYAHLLPDATRDAVNHIWPSESFGVLHTDNAAADEPIDE